MIATSHNWPYVELGRRRPPACTRCAEAERRRRDKRRRLARVRLGYLADWGDCILAGVSPIDGLPLEAVGTS